MKDELDKLVSDNRESFDDKEPFDGHFERFEAKLKKVSKPNRNYRVGIIVKVAAVVVIALLAANKAWMWLSPSPAKHQILSLGEIEPQYRDAEFYYTNAIQNGMKQLVAFGEEGLLSTDDLKMLKKEQEEFDQMYQELLVDMKTNPGDERVINAMLVYYQSRMNVIMMIINKLEETKKPRIRANETNMTLIN